MPHRQLNIVDAARYLRMSAAELEKLSCRGYVPGRRVGGEWRFFREELNEWVERQMPQYSVDELVDMEKRMAVVDHPSEAANRVVDFLRPWTIDLALPAKTRPSVLRCLVDLAAASGAVLDPDALLRAVVEREELYSTALGPGVAFPHPRRPNPAIVSESVVALGRTPQGIAFGAPDGTLTRLFFLICCTTAPAHLRMLARLSRLVRDPRMTTLLMESEDSQALYESLEAIEAELFVG